MTRASLAVALTASFLAACSSNSSGGTTGGGCLAGGAACAESGCCEGYSCVQGFCLSETGSGNGTGTGNGTGNGGTTGSGNGPGSGATTSGATHGTSASASATVGATSSGTGIGTGPGGTTSGIVASSTSGTTGTPLYCNGVQMQDSDGDNFYLATYPLSDEVRTGCLATIEGLFDGGSATLGAVGGILDNDTYATQAGVMTIDPAGCDDLGAGSAPVINSTSITPPAGASDVEDARSNQLDGGTVYGIVTWIDSPFYSTTEAKGIGGTLYLQDDSGDAASGIAVYISGSFATATGIAGYPDSGLARGDVVAITGLLWSPYGGSAAVNVQDQLVYSAGSAVTILGTEPLPTPISISAEEIVDGEGPNYVGMRVSLETPPATVVNACPSVLEGS